MRLQSGNLLYLLPQSDNLYHNRRSSIINIEHYDALLSFARQQLEPQLILFVFTQSELPDGYNEIQKKSFDDEQGGALKPIMYVDKRLDELGSFADMVVESEQMGQHWHVVFVAALSGRNGVLPSTEQTQVALEMMVKSIQQGAISRFLAYDRKGNAIQLT